MMRLFKRRDSDPNPHLESVSTLQNENSIEFGSRLPKPTHQKPYLSTWGKAWDKITRQDSFEQIPYKKPIHPEEIKSKISQEDIKKVYEMYKNVSNNTDNSVRNRTTTRSRRNLKCVSDNIELNQQQFLDYLMLMKPNNDELDKIFDEQKTPKKKTRKSKLKSMFTMSSSSKSDDESETPFKKMNQKSSSTDSLTSLLNYIMPKRRQKSPLGNGKFKSDESGYGSDSTKTTALNSPIGSIKSQTSQEVDTDAEMDKTLVDKYRDVDTGDDTDTADEEIMDTETTYTFSKFYARSPIKSATKKRARSKSRDDSTKNEIKRRTIKFSPEKDLNDLNKNVENMKITEPKPTVLEKEFKCVRLKVKKPEMAGIKISPSNNGKSYFLTEILPNSVASKNENLKIGDEVIKANGIRIKGLPYQTAKRHFEPKNNELELVISRTSKPVKKRTNSFKAFLNKPAQILSPKKNPVKSPRNNNSIPNKTPSKLSLSISPKTLQTLSPSKSQTPQKSYVGLNDILSMESRVTFSEKPLQKNIKKPPLSPKGTSVSRTPSPGNSPSLYGMRKFSLSNSTRPQITKCLPITNANKTQNKTVTFIKGPGKKSLGFSIVGGRDSPKGPMGIYVKTIFKDGQASENKTLQAGDELLSINGTSFKGRSHLEAVALFKTIKCGQVIVEVANRQGNRTYSQSM
ncbi:unnamed protein product [Ceutorhynchus assimilis]|uniref:PDZ domain-containing protein n=1 Tax=Ceutorhynchus assimilis TaxID=467358 RepID=A0A9N9N0A0_9CUCU|nr:unnamed protein product [Ceutorhynchus assimilis]